MTKEYKKTKSNGVHDLKKEIFKCNNKAGPCDCFRLLIEDGQLPRKSREVEEFKEDQGIRPKEKYSEGKV